MALQGTPDVVDLSCIALTGWTSVSVMELAKFIKMIGMAVGGPASAGSGAGDIYQ